MTRQAGSQSAGGRSLFTKEGALIEFKFNKKIVRVLFLVQRKHSHAGKSLGDDLNDQLYTDCLWWLIVRSLNICNKSLRLGNIGIPNYKSHSWNRTKSKAQKALQNTQMFSFYVSVRLHFHWIVTQHIWAMLHRRQHHEKSNKAHTESKSSLRHIYCSLTNSLSAFNHAIIQLLHYHTVETIIYSTL